MLNLAAIHEYVKFISRIEDHKKQICHELAIAFAARKAFDESDPDFPRSVMGQLEENERMLALYTWCYDDLLSRFEDIIKHYCELREDKLNR